MDEKSLKRIELCGIYSEKFSKFFENPKRYLSKTK